MYYYRLKNTKIEIHSVKRNVISPTIDNYKSAFLILQLNALLGIIVPRLIAAGRSKLIQQPNSTYLFIFFFNF